MGNKCNTYIVSIYDNILLKSDRKNRNPVIFSICKILQLQKVDFYTKIIHYILFQAKYYLSSICRNHYMTKILFK